MVRFAVLCFFVSGVAFAQVGFGIGLKGGFASPGYYQNGISGADVSDRSSGFAGGPYAEARMGPFALGVEALYRKIGRDASGSGASQSWSNKERGSVWEAPLLAKVRLPQIRMFRPFVEAGPSIRRLNSTVTTTTETRATGPQGELIITRTTSTDPVHQWTSGFAAGAGIERSMTMLRVTFEGRLTRWKASDNACGAACREQSQFEFLFGIGF